MDPFERHRNRKLKQIKQSFSYNHKRPSQTTDVQWIYAINNSNNYPDDTDRGGKWLIFTPIKELHKRWESIKHATKLGQLGDASKVSTMKPSHLVFDPNLKVICVYTYEWKDEEDVFRIRDRLFELGFVDKLVYKTNEDTMKGRYAWKGDKNVYKYEV